MRGKLTACEINRNSNIKNGNQPMWWCDAILPQNIKELFTPKRTQSLKWIHNIPANIMALEEEDEDNLLLTHSNFKYPTWYFLMEYLRYLWRRRTLELSFYLFRSHYLLFCLQNNHNMSSLVWHSAYKCPFTSRSQEGHIRCYARIPPTFTFTFFAHITIAFCNATAATLLQH